MSGAPFSDVIPRCPPSPWMVLDLLGWWLLGLLWHASTKHVRPPKQARGNNKEDQNPAPRRPRSSASKPIPTPFEQQATCSSPPSNPGKEKAVVGSPTGPRRQAQRDTLGSWATATPTTIPATARYTGLAEWRRSRCSRCSRRTRRTRFSSISHSRRRARAPAPRLTCREFQDQLVRDQPALTMSS